MSPGKRPNSPSPASTTTDSRRVVVTGLGLVCPLGDCVASVDKALVGGAIAESAPVPAAQGIWGCLEDWSPAVIEQSARKKMSPVVQYAHVASQEALGQARLDPTELDCARVGVLIGTMLGGMHEVAFIYRLLEADRKRRAGGRGTTKFMNSAAAVHVAAEFGFRGPAVSISSGFGTGLDNIGCGYEWIRNGKVDIAVCGASEENCAEFLGRKFALWERSDSPGDGDLELVPRPFDVDREGAVLAPGCGILVLESAESAGARGVPPLAEIQGHAACFESTSGLDDFAAPLAKSIESVLRQAAVAGTNSLTQILSGAAGFRAADVQHAAAIRDTLGATARVTSTGGLVGHALGASSAVNAVFAAARGGGLVPCHGLQQVAPECQGLEYVCEPTATSDPAVLVTAGGLGYGSSLAVRRVLP